MNILIYSQVFFPVLGGLQRNTYTLANTLLSLGHAVSVYTETLEESDSKYAFTVVRSNAVSDLTKQIKKADLVFINGGVSIKVALICLLHRKKYNIIYQTAEGVYVNRGLKKLALTSLRVFLAKAAVFNIVQTHSSVQSIGRNSSNVLVLINPVDPEIFEYAKDTPGKKYDFLFAGRVIKEKGIYVLLDAMQILQKKGVKTSLAIAGDGTELSNILSIIEANQLPITYLGNIDKKELASAYLSSRTLVVPTDGHMEGSPLVISEAISLNTPVLVSDQPAMIEAVGKSGLVFKSGDAQQLADLMQEVLLNPATYSKLAAACKEEAVKFSPVSYKKTLAEKILSKQVVN